MRTAAHPLLVLTAVSTALITGLFYSYACSVNPGLHELSDANYLAAMQSINVAIQNPVFFGSFIGTLVLLPLSAYLHRGRPFSRRFRYLLAASGVYGLGVFGVTAWGNVPLNNMLAGLDLSTATPEALAQYRKLFEAPWNAWHTVRTFFAVLTELLVVLACLARPGVEEVMRAD